ncbi:MAG: hypothetical protein U0528_17905 [Anaerolineae bacterium]
MRVSGTYFTALLGSDGKWAMETAFTRPDLIGLASNAAQEFPLPSPTADYQAYLAAWTRPVDDNGLCIHYLASPLDDPFELRLQLSRLKKLNIKWLLVNYTSRTQTATDGSGVQARWHHRDLASLRASVSGVLLLVARCDVPAYSRFAALPANLQRAESGTRVAGRWSASGSGSLL